MSALGTLRRSSRRGCLRQQHLPPPHLSPRSSNGWHCVFGMRLLAARRKVVFTMQEIFPVTIGNEERERRMEQMLLSIQQMHQQSSRQQSPHPDQPTSRTRADDNEDSFDDLIQSPHHYDRNY